jgi:signal peptidase II
MRKALLMAVLAALIFIGDQVTKYWAVAELTDAFEVAHASSGGEKLRAFAGQKDLLERRLAGPYRSAGPEKRVVVSEQYAQLIYTQNRGAAFSFLAGAGENIRVPFFHLVTLLALVFIVLYARRLEESQRLLQIALALLLGGALGNGLDRILRGYVIDFIAVYWRDPSWLRPSLHWPTFNVADCGVTIGIVLLLLESLLQRKKHESPQVQPSP